MKYNGACADGAANMTAMTSGTITRMLARGKEMGGLAMRAGGRFSRPAYRSPQMYEQRWLR